MSKSRMRKRQPKHVLALTDLEQSKAEVLNSLTSKSGDRTYDPAITDFVEVLLRAEAFLLIERWFYGTESFSNGSVMHRLRSPSGSTAFAHALVFFFHEGLRKGPFRRASSCVLYGGVGRCL
jgi:hypothetical protein